MRSVRALKFMRYPRVRDDGNKGGASLPLGAAGISSNSKLHEMCQSGYLERPCFFISQVCALSGQPGYGSYGPSSCSALKHAHRLYESPLGLFMVTLLGNPSLHQTMEPVSLVHLELHGANWSSAAFFNSLIFLPSWIPSCRSWYPLVGSPRSSKKNPPVTFPTYRYFW